MLKMVLLDHAINEKCCSGNWCTTGHLPSFFIPTLGDLTAQESSPIQDKKNANARGSTCGGGGGAGGLGAAGIDTDALFLNNRLIQPLGCDVILNKLSFYIYPKKKEKHEAIRKSEKGYS